MILLPELADYKHRYQKGEHQPLRITMRLRNNAPLADYDPVCLDNLLAGAVVREAFHTNQMPPSNAPYDLPVPLSCLWRSADDLPLYAATYFAPLGEPERDSIYHHRRLQSGAFSRGKNGELKLSGSVGRFMERRLPLPVKICRDWEAYCFGEAKEILRLLEQISFVGKRRNAGFGEIDEWIVEPLAQLENLLVRENKLTRSIPADSCTAGLLGGYEILVAPELVGWTPPQWRPSLFRAGWRVGSPVEID
ncbi:MAG TPA: hypothetical protein VGD05_12800, partial [Pyrinomonadaceae bacterium]